MVVGAEKKGVGAGLGGGEGGFSDLAGVFLIDEVFGVLVVDFGEQIFEAESVFGGGGHHEVTV